MCYEKPIAKFVVSRVQAIKNLSVYPWYPKISKNVGHIGCVLRNGVVKKFPCPCDGIYRLIFHLKKFFAPDSYVSLGGYIYVTLLI